MKELPFGGEFSPNQVDLFWLLLAIQEHHNPAELQEAIRAKYFATSCLTYSGAMRTKQQLKRAGNVLIGLRSYGLLERESVLLTQLGAKLASMDVLSAKEEFARHIVVELQGVDVLNAIQVLLERGEKVTKETLTKQLVNSDFKMPRATTKHLTLLLWLGEAGIVNNDHSINQKRLAQVLKTDEEAVRDLDDLGNQERRFLRALSQVVVAGNLRASVSDVRNLAERLYSLDWPQDRIQTKLQPLERRGWIILERGTSGRGAKGGFVTAAPRLQSSLVQRLLEKEAALLSPELRAGLRLSFSAVVAQVNSDDKHIKGKGLELLALQLSRFLGMTPRKWRLRSSRTGGAEVDLIVESANFMFSRWQIQCKNAANVHLEDLAKEIGIAALIKSNVIAMVTTGRFGNVLRQHANAIMDQTNLQVILIDGANLKRIKDADTPALELTTQVAAQSEQALKLKSKQILLDIED